MLPWITRRCLAPHTDVFHRVFPTFGPGRGLLSNPFLPSPPSRFGTAMAGAYALVGGRVGTGEVCLVGVQSDFPAPAVHRERQRPDRPVLHSKVRDSTKSYSYCGGKRRIFRDAQRQSLAVRSSKHTLQEDAGPTSSTSAEKTGAHGPRGGPLLLGFHA